MWINIEMCNVKFVHCFSDNHFIRSFVCSTLELPRHFSCKRLFLIFFFATQCNTTQYVCTEHPANVASIYSILSILIRLVAIQRRKLHIKQRDAILIYVRNHRKCTNVVGQKAHVYFRIFFDTMTPHSQMHAQTKPFYGISIYSFRHDLSLWPYKPWYSWANRPPSTQHRFIHTLIFFVVEHCSGYILDYVRNSW